MLISSKIDQKYRSIFDVAATPRLLRVPSVKFRYNTPSIVRGCKYAGVFEFLIFLYEILFGSTVLSSFCCRSQIFYQRFSSSHGNEAQSSNFGRSLFVLIKGFTLQGVYIDLGKTDLSPKSVLVFLVFTTSRRNDCSDQSFDWTRENTAL